MRYDWGFGSVHFLAGLGVAATFLLSNLIVKGIIRVNRYALLFAAVLLGMAFIHSATKRNSVTTVALAVLVLLSACLAANAAYEPNRHMTYAEYDGSQFMASNIDEGVPIHAMDTSHKMEAFVLGTNHARYYPPSFSMNNNLPRNLGYFSQDVIASDTFGRSYVVTKSHDVKQHTASYYTKDQQDYLSRYGDDSLARIHNDPTANKVYTNGGFTGWSVAPEN